MNSYSYFIYYFSFFDDPDPEYVIGDDIFDIKVVTKYQSIKNYSDFINVFKRAFKILKEKNPFITLIVFCDLEIQKFKKLISEFDESLSKSGKDLQDFLLSSHYLRAKTYLEFLSDFRISISEKQDAAHDSITKTFPQYIEHIDQIFIAEKLKTNFFGKKGKTIRLMIEVLKAKNSLNIIEGSNSQFYRSMKEYFNWEIGTYNSIFQTYEYKPDNAKCKKDFTTTSVIIDGILNITKN